jgi:hypothetical protein
MPTKDETAQLLADAHFRLDQGITRIFRIVERDEGNPERPVKLLEVNPLTPEVGISPVGMTADAARGVFYSSVVVEISPAEFDQLRRGELRLPHGWTVGSELLPHSPAAAGSPS